MFKLRDTLPTDDEIRRQNIIRRIIFRTAEPLTLLEKKAAAITGHPSIDPILTAKAFKKLPEILSELRDEADLLDAEFRNRLAKTLAATRLEPNDPIILPRKKPIFVSPVTLTAPPPLAPLEILSTRAISSVSLAEFEALAFNSKILYKYYKDTSFASYLFQNLIYSQNLMNRAQLSDLHSNAQQNWQTRLASLLYIANANERLATDVFYSDTVEHKGFEYDVSFVPKYDVLSIQPLSEIEPPASEQSMINYYYSVDLATEKVVPKRYLGIFLSFPFKSGYYVHPNGSIVFTNLPRIDRQSVVGAFARICDVSDIEAAVENVAAQVSLDDAVSYAAYAKTLTAQGVALMVARRIVGRDTIYLPTAAISLRLDDEQNLLSWMNFSCVRGQILLPILYGSPTGDRTVALIRDIAASCRSKIGAAIVCSSYVVPEIDINYAHTRLVTDAERYVLYTLVLQQYPKGMYYAARNALRPEFGTRDLDMSGYERSVRRSNVNVTPKNYRALMFSDDPGPVPNNCTTDRCLDNYEFTDPQLKALSLADDDNGDEIELSEYQIAAYVASSAR